MLSPDHVNKLIGSRLKNRREACGLSQEELALKIEVSPADLRHFEEGKKRIPARALFEASSLLEADLNWFFESTPSQEESHSDGLSVEVAAFLALPESGELIRNFLEIRTETQRRLVVQYASRVSAGYLRAGTSP